MSVLSKLKLRDTGYRALDEFGSKSTFEIICLEDTLTPESYGYATRWVMTGTFSVVFYAENDPVVLAEAQKIAKRALASCMFRDAISLVHDAMSAVSSGRKLEAMRALQAVLNELESIE